MRKDVFKNEIALISNKELREWTLKVLDNTPEYFFKAPASSTGKYHPDCTLGEGGLIVHVKRAFYIAERLCNGWGIVGIERDIVLLSTILHDIAKTGKGSGSYDDYVNHPLNAKKYFVAISEELKPNIEIIENCIKFHMGLWTPESIKKPLKEYSLMELLVYTSDYISSTKTLTTPKDKKEN